jgi:hypothetical protein
MVRLLWLLLLPACVFPLATGAPLPASTVGANQVGFANAVEAPTINLLASDPAAARAETPQQPHSARAVSGMVTGTLSYGLTDTLDLEVATHTALLAYFLVFPIGGSIGLRSQIARTEHVDIAVAAQVGIATTRIADLSGSADAYYAAAQLVAQAHGGWFRPALAIGVTPFDVDDRLEDPHANYTGMVLSSTFAATFVTRWVQLGPYVTYSGFESAQFAGARVVSGGFMFAIRRDRR